MARMRRKFSWRTRRGKRYKVLCTKEGLRPEDYGSIDYKDRVISVWPKMSKFSTVDTLIHEALHAEFPNLRECDVNDASTAITRLLRKARMI